jgi:amino acid adenylation domain-containing protein
MEQVFVRVDIDETETYATLAAKTARELREAVARGRSCVSDRGLDYVTLNMLPPFPENFAGHSANFTMGAAPTWPGVRSTGVGDLRDTFGMQLIDFSCGSLRIGFTFHAATFDEGQRQRMGDHFIRVLDAMAADPGAAIDGVDLLDEAEKREILARARGPEPDGVAQDVVERFRAHAQRRPQHPSVEGPEGTFTYAEFDRLTDILARKLRSLGVGRESRVGVALPRGVREIAALLATYKASGAYVPVDPSHPIDRVRLILEDAAPEVLIAPSGSPLAAAVPASTKLLALDDVRKLHDEGGPPLDHEVADHQLAYILFTSGSTGRPKGVEIPRSAFANFLRAMTDKPGLGEHERLLAITTTTFDIAGLELFLPLYVGATVVIADRETGADPRRLAARLERGDISMLQATPASWRLLLESGWKGDGRLRMLCGGEAMSPELAEKLTSAGRELWNVYGPTETTVWSTIERVERGAPRITIGRPIDHTQIYLLDAHRKLVSGGVVGELYIGGRGLARGYRGRPDLTAERFVDNPFGPPGDRIYRTGDLARLLPDGRFECLGRVDHQVKIRGFRIELGEIESVLRTVPGAKEVLVVADTTRRADPLLCAYWVGDATREALLQRATARLPSYMVPSAYVQVPVFPLNSNGKIDRKALPPPEVGAVAPTGGVAPQGIAQERMAAIWSELLGLSLVGVDQSFFDLGGTSVLAIQARAAIEKSFGVELPLRAFFETPTIAQLVDKLGSKDSSTEPIVMMLRRGKGDALPVHCLVGVEIYRDLAQSLDGDWPVIAMHVPLRYVPGREPLPSVMELATHYVKAIRGRQAEGPYHLAGLCFGGIVAYEAARQLEAAGETVATVTIFDGYLPSAMSVDRSAQLLDYAQRAFSAPGRLMSKVRERVSNSLARFNRQSRASADAGKAVDLPLDGPEVDETTRQYELAREGVLRSGHLIIFRATGRGWQPWVHLQPDLGWGKLAARVSVHDLNCDHLDLVRQPHVREVAAFMQAALVTDSPRQAESLALSQRLRAPDSIPAMSQRSGPR